jgi:hypothetical protein
MVVERQCEVVELGDNVHAEQQARLCSFDGGDVDAHRAAPALALRPVVRRQLSHQGADRQVPLDQHLVSVSVHFDLGLQAAVIGAERGMDDA